MPAYKVGCVLGDSLDWKFVEGGMSIKRVGKVSEKWSHNIVSLSLASDVVLMSLPAVVFVSFLCCGFNLP